MNRPRRTALHPAAASVARGLALGVAVLLMVGAAHPAPAAVVAEGLLEQRVRDGLGNPTTFAFLPDGRVVIGDRGGRIRLFTADFADSATVGIVPAVRTTGEGGLGGLAPDPAWPERPFLYVFYTSSATGSLVLARYRVSGPLTAPDSLGLALGTRVDLIADFPDASPAHNGGDLQFAPDSLLYLSLGDDGDRCGAQDSTSRVGAIWRLDVRGVADTATVSPPWPALVPSGNPYAADTTAAAFVFCHGLRNPFRFAFDPPHGALLIGDVGGSRFEEIDESLGGENFGWPIWEADSVRGELCGLGALEPRDPPVYSYAHAFGLFAVTGGPVYRRAGGALQLEPDYEGDYFLAEFYAGWIRRLERDGSGWRLAPAAPGQPDSLHWATGVPGITCMRVGPDGGIYYTRLFDGDFRRIIRATESAVSGEIRGDPSTGGAVLRAAPNPTSRSRGLWFLATTERGQPDDLLLFDIAGRRVRTLRGRDMVGGRLHWDATDDRGRRVAAGTYFARPAGGARGGEALRIVLLP